MPWVEQRSHSGFYVALALVSGAEDMGVETWVWLALFMYPGDLWLPEPASNLQQPWEMVAPQD